MRMVSEGVKCRLCALIAMATLSACAFQGTGGSNATSVNVLPQIDTHHENSKVEKVLYRFKGVNDGSDPEPELVAVGTTLYGTTFEGGDPSCAYVFYGSSGCGTIFKIDTSGSGYAVLYRFGKTATSGMFPTLGVIDKDSKLFGTAFYGGGDGSKCDPRYNGCGTLFQIDPTGKEFKVLHDFVGGQDGEGPYANLASANNTLYGATNSGGYGGCDGQGGCGVAYAFDLTSRTESIVYPFKGGTDGTYPSSVIDVKGMLYGVTYAGGSLPSCPSGSSYDGCGTIFRIDAKSGKESVLYRFKGGKDGAFPDNVLSIGGDLYGATEYGGGGSGCGGSGFSGCGTIFKVSETSGEETVLHRFKAGADGALPNQILANVNGSLYGTTVYGGGSHCGSSGCGTIFKIDTSGKGYAVVYSFLGRKDGAYPTSGVTAVSGTLYGTTSSGGGKGCGGSGCGTIFEATP